MPQTQSQAPTKATPPPATRAPQCADVCTPWDGRTMIDALTAGIGRPNAIADLNQWFERTHRAKQTDAVQMAELVQRIEALESMVNTLTELLIHGPEANAQ